MRGGGWVGGSRHLGNSNSHVSPPQDLHVGVKVEAAEMTGQRGACLIWSPQPAEPGSPPRSPPGTGLAPGVPANVLTVRHSRAQLLRTGQDL